jgi:hypothetical protein
MGLRDHTHWAHHNLYDSSGRVISPTQRPLPDSTQLSQETDIHAPGGIEPTISASERQQPHALDRAATGLGNKNSSSNLKFHIVNVHTAEITAYSIIVLNHEILTFKKVMRL